MIGFFNANEGFMSVVLSIIGLIVSIVAIIISIYSIKIQSKITVFNEKYAVFYELDEFIDKWIYYFDLEKNLRDEFFEYSPFGLKCRYSIANFYIFNEMFEYDLSIEEVCSHSTSLKIGNLHNEMITTLSKAIFLFGYEREITNLIEKYVEYYRIGMYNYEEKEERPIIVNSFIYVLKNMKKDVLPELRKQIKMV